MNRRQFLASCGAVSLAACRTTGGSAVTRAATPNVVIIFLDDSGYADFPPFGDPIYHTPNVQRLADEGCAYTQFYVPQAVCSASRAALMTGCYPGRTGVFGAHGPNARGLETTFPTMAEVLKPAGYKTAVFGKWHIGDQPETRPFARGFDETCGLMYSNDMWEFHPQNPDHWGKFPLQFWEQDEVAVERVTPKEQRMLTTWYTEHAVDFIDRNAADPFLLYVPHSMPHVPLYCSDKFEGKSGQGLYADVMMEIDWSVGQIMDALERNGVDDNTLVIFTSDNGPWTSYGNHAGLTPFREAKGTSFDGGVRSACLMKFPGHIDPGSTNPQAFSSIDILPTVAQLAGAPVDHVVDGEPVFDIITGDPSAKNPHEYYPFSNGRHFEGVISGDGRWKLHVPHKYRHVVETGNDGDAGKYEQRQIDTSLFDMHNDPYETTNVIDRYPDAAKRLALYATGHYDEFYQDRD